MRSAVPGLLFFVALSHLAGCGTDPLPANGGITPAPPCLTDAECDDQNPCTINICAPGGCKALAAPLACDDGDPCTGADVCVDGACVSGANICACQVDSDCSDGDACNGAEVCGTDAGVRVCQPGAPVLCEPDAPCQVAACDPATGLCAQAPAPDGLACDDGQVCTVGDACKSGACTSGDDICVCQSDGDCDDGDACNGTERCDASVFPGRCLAGESIVCTSADPCAQSLCEPSTGACTASPLPNGTPCEDGDLCTVSDTCQDGICGAGLNLCVCQVDADCDDGDLCNGAETCDVENFPPTCVASDEAPAECTPSAACEVASCDPGTGGCVFADAPDGTFCDDDEPCTVGEVCGGGACGGGVPICGCVSDADCDNGDACDGLETCQAGSNTCQPGTPVVCGDVGPCANAICLPGTGDCVAVPLMDGTACDDQDACSVGDACLAGVCGGTAPLECADKTCGLTSDGCSCGTCANGELCDASGQCLGDGDACGHIPPDGACVAGAGLRCDGGALHVELCPDCGACADCNAECQLDEVGCSVFATHAYTCESVDGCLRKVWRICDKGCGANGACIGEPTDPPGPVGDEASIVQTGTTDAYRLLGLVVTPSGAVEGEVLVVGDTIACVASSCADHAQAAGAWVIDTQGVILPGLIDTHNHILFDVFNNDDWGPNLPDTCTTEADCKVGTSYCGPAGKCACVNGACYYTNHGDWPGESEYQLMLDYKQCLADASQGKPDWCPQKYDGDGDVKCELQKWGELKGLIAGTTSIVGLPGTSGKCVGSLVRSVDVSQNDLPGGDAIQTSALFPPSKSAADGVCANFSDGDTHAYLIHVGEGTDSDALNEFQKLFTLTAQDGCLYDERTTITHGTAFGLAEFTTMAQHGMKLTWSPASNVALYGATTDIPTALTAGVLVTLAPDWSMGGSQNLLDELRFAHQWDHDHFGDVLTSQDLTEMVTSNAAFALGLSPLIGQLAEGAMADIVVVASTGGSPYDALVAASPADVRLVMIGGVPLYGDQQLGPAAPQTPGCDAVDICGTPKFLCVAEDSAADKLGQTLTEVSDALQTATADLDALMPVDAVTFCGGCKASEECFLYAAKPTVDGANCPASCPSGEVCVHVSKSGAIPYACRPEYTCSPAKTQKSFAPIAPLVACP